MPEDGGAGAGAGPDLAGLVWKSSVMAAVFAGPPLAILLGIYGATGDIVFGAAAGFGAHFAVLAFSGRISRLLIRGGRGGSGRGDAA